MADQHVSYEEIAAGRRGSAEYRKGYDEARRAFPIGQPVEERRGSSRLSRYWSGLRRLWSRS